MPFKIEKLSPDLDYGALVEGVSLQDLEDEATRARLKATFIQDGLVIFRNCDVSHELHIGLSAIAGDISIHPLAETMAVAGHRELIRLKYDPETEAVFEVDGVPLGGYIPWHFDAVFTAASNRGGILRMETPSAVGGDTGYIDRIGVYSALPQPLKDRIEDLEVIYGLDIEYGFPYIPRTKIKLLKEGAIYRGSRIRYDAGDIPPVVHKLVSRQQETGRKILNFSPLMARHVVGMDHDESHELLTELSYHATDESRAYIHRWESVDELILWDNWRMLHKACGVPEDDERAVIRTTIGSDYRCGRLAEPHERDLGGP